MLHQTCWAIFAALALITGGAINWAIADDAPAAVTTETPATQEATPAEKSGEKPKAEVPRVSLEVARDRAVLMHDIYNASMDAMHHRYFHGDRAFVPARAMEDVFADIERAHHSSAKWIGASFTPMSIDHEPETDFEKMASRKIAQGEEYVEIIEEGYYRRAGSVRLSAGCISCHSGAFGTFSTSKKFAGLVISIPVNADAQLDQVSVVEK